MELNSIVYAFRLSQKVKLENYLWTLIYRDFFLQSDVFRQKLLAAKTFFFCFLIHCCRRCFELQMVANIKRIREGSNNALRYLAMRSICLRLSSKGYMCYRTNTCLIIRKQATSLGFLAKIKWEGKSIPSSTVTRLVVFCNEKHLPAPLKQRLHVLS